MITEWSLLTEQMIGSIGWKSTSFTMLRWPGRRYLRLTLSPLAHLIASEVVSYTYTNPSPLPGSSPSTGRGSTSTAASSRWLPATPHTPRATPTVCPRISFTQRLSPSKNALMSHTRSPAYNEWLSLRLTSPQEGTSSRRRARGGFP